MCIRDRPNISRHELTITMHHLSQRSPKGTLCISASLVGCQDLVRFFALRRIKPHTPPVSYTHLVNIRAICLVQRMHKRKNFRRLRVIITSECADLKVFNVLRHSFSLSLIHICVCACAAPSKSPGYLQKDECPARRRRIFQNVR